MEEGGCNGDTLIPSWLGVVSPVPIPISSTVRGSTSNTCPFRLGRRGAASRSVTLSNSTQNTKLEILRTYPRLLKYPSSYSEPGFGALRGQRASQEGFVNAKTCIFFCHFSDWIHWAGWENSVTKMAKEDAYFGVDRTFLSARCLDL